MTLFGPTYPVPTLSPCCCPFLNPLLLNSQMPLVSGSCLHHTGAFLHQPSEPWLHTQRLHVSIRYASFPVLHPEQLRSLLTCSDHS